MAEFYLKYSLEKNNGLVLKITEIGSSRSQRIRMLSKLPFQNPNLKDWNSETERFKESSEAEEQNNAFLREYKKPFQYVIDNCNPTTAKEIKEKGLAKDFSIKASGVSLGQFLRDYIHKERTEIQPNKMPSGNWQLYDKLLKKLEREGLLIDMPISQITDIEYEQFGKFLLKNDGYKQNMRYFKTVINKARMAKLTEVCLTYDYKKNAPIKNKAIKAEESKTVTKEQYKLFYELNLTKAFPEEKPETIRKYELYRDFCVFMFETIMRPIDVCMLKTEQIDFGKNWLRYIPKKKRNKTKDKIDKITTAPLNSRAKAIVEKYKGQSANGFVFPFAFSDRKEWDWNNPVEWDKYALAEKKILQAINKLLKKLKPKLGITTEKFTLYTFRHSVMTFLLQDGIQPMILAHMGGTSIEMLNEHYYDVMNDFKAPEIKLDDGF